MKTEITDRGLTGTVVQFCQCISQYQDEQYGVGKRVHNRGGKKEKPHVTCTVCGRRK